MKIHKRLTYANIVATLALVFAMSGGALAASKYLITSTKQISPKVIKALKGKAGPRGLQGLQGSQGLQGKEGPTGKEGLAGKEGKQGKEGKEGEEGPAGAPATKLWAAVDENSAVVRSSGGVTIQRVFAGLYRMTFPQNVTNCATVVSVGATTAGNNLQTGEAASSASGGSLGTNVVSVGTFNDSGTFTDKPFDLAVFC